MTTTKKSQGNLELSIRTKARRCAARKPNLWRGEHENQSLLCVLFSFVIYSIRLKNSIREVTLVKSNEIVSRAGCVLPLENLHTVPMC